MLDLRKRIFILVGIIAGVAAAILLVIFVFYSDRPVEEEVPPVTNTPTLSEDDFIFDYGSNTGEENAIPRPTTPAVDEGAEERFVKHFARTFVERFGSYSNQNDNRHIEEALEMSTARMQDWINTQAVAQSGSYTGATAQVIASNVTSFTASAATVTIGVQEVLQVANGEEQRNYKNGRVELQKVGDTWLVDGLYFE